MAGKVYYWIGGYTGGTGPESGYSAASELWINLENGAISTIGDVWFSPYSWKYPQNWMEEQTVGGTTRYVMPTTTPKGGDAIFFGGATDGSSGKQINPYKYSLLFGGMSGDGWTASGSTAWHGATQAEDIAYNISVVVQNDYKLEFASLTSVGQSSDANYIPTVAGITASRCMIGRGFTGVLSPKPWETEYVKLDYIKPLNMRIDTMDVFTRTFRENERSPMIAINNMVNRVAGFNNYAYYQRTGLGDPKYGKRSNVLTVLKGSWDNILQFNGSLWMNSCSVGSFIVGYPNWGTILETISTDAATTIETCTIRPNIGFSGPVGFGGPGSSSAVNGQIVVQGDASGSKIQDLKIYGWSGPQRQITLGLIGDKILSTFGNVLVQGVGITSEISRYSPQVQLCGASIDALTARGNCTVGVSELASDRDYPTISTGVLYDQSILNMSHPKKFDTWKNFILGTTGNNNTGVTVRSRFAAVSAFPGQTLTTSPALTGL